MQTISHNEEIALIQCNKVLGRYDIILCSPENISPVFIGKNWRIEYFNKDFFVSRKSYSEMMLNPLFYERFVSYDYLLVYQLDAFVFSDQLIRFCNLGYDYIGAPWINGISVHTNSNSKVMYVGNGGFSLRNVKKFFEWTKRKESYIKYMLSECSKEEDAIIAYDGELNIAPYEIAQEFAIETGAISKKNSDTECNYFGAHRIFDYNPRWSFSVYKDYGYTIEKSDNPRQYNAEWLKMENCVFQQDLWRSLFWSAIRDLLPLCKDSVALWGAGNVGMRVRNLCKQVNMCIDTFIETSPEKSDVLDCRVVSASEYLKSVRNNIIVTQKNSEETIEYLKHIGYRKNVHYIEYRDIIKWIYEHGIKKSPLA